jgi:arabinofuranosyltransferase
MARKRPALASLLRWAPQIAVVLLFAGLFAWNAWLCDDAFITLRVLDNLIRGEGLRWNALERVQVFTSPLHALLLAPLYWLVSDPAPLPNPNRAYLASMLFSFVLSLAALLVLERRLRGPLFWPLLALLFSSQAFVIFTSSGLETPLAYLILALFFTAFLHGSPQRPRDVLRLLLLAALGVLTRLDLALLLLPASAAVLATGLRRFGWSAARAAALAALPLALWFGFALVYYGFLLPNSFYAKVGTGVESSLLAQMGRAYLARSLAQDPITLATIGACLVASALDRRVALAALGSVAYVAYVVRIGGDFIGFRFLAPPFLVCALALHTAAVSHLRRGRVPFAAAAVLAALAYGLLIPSTPVRVHWDLPPAPGDVSHYFPASNLARWRPGMDFPFARFSIVSDIASCRAMQAREFTVSSIGSGGLPGFCRGPRQHFLDRVAITDPLLARLPTSSSGPFLPGHLLRPLPEGYLESVVEGENRIRDPQIAAYYEKLRVVTQGPLFTRERWGAIFALNFTRERRYPGPVRPGVPFRSGRRAAGGPAAAPPAAR